MDTKQTRTIRLSLAPTALTFFANQTSMPATRERDAHDHHQHHHDHTPKKLHASEQKPVPHTHDHDHAYEEGGEHLLGFPYWHFMDFGSDALRIAIKPLNHNLTTATQQMTRWGAVARHALPATLKLARFLPVVGVVGEAAHVYTPAKRVFEDWREGRLSGTAAAGLGISYAGYVASGLGGIFSVVGKEALTNSVQAFDLVDEAYVPHSLYTELEHAGVLRGLPRVNGALKNLCPECGRFHVGPADHEAHRQAPRLLAGAKRMRTQMPAN